MYLYTYKLEKPELTIDVYHNRAEASTDYEKKVYFHYENIEEILADLNLLDYVDDLFVI